LSYRFEVNKCISICNNFELAATNSIAYCVKVLNYDRKKLSASHWASKLECLFQAKLLSFIHFSGALLEGKLLALPAYIRQAPKGLPETNAIAYFPATGVTNKKYVL
jgi:hypothetical protein